MERADKDSNRAFYDSERESDRRRFEQDPSKRFVAETIVGWIASSLARGDRLLDVAGGSGFYASQIVRTASVAVAGLDISESMVRQRATDPALELNVVGDMEALPFASGSFDAVMFVACLHHVPDPLPALREALRVLRPGGQLFAHEPCSLLARRAGVAQVPGVPHEFRVSMAHLADGIRAAGFESVHVTGKQLTMRLFDPFLRRPPLRLFRACDRVDRVLTLLPGLGRLAATGMFHARRPGAGPRADVPELAGLLACPRCRGPLDPAPDGLRCPTCDAAYPVPEGVPVFDASGLASGRPVG